MYFDERRFLRKLHIKIFRCFPSAIKSFNLSWTLSIIKISAQKKIYSRPIYGNNNISIAHHLPQLRKD